MNTPDWALDPQLLEALPYIKDWLVDADPDLTFESSPLEYHEGFFTCPILSPLGCDYFLEMADSFSAAFSRNKAENEAYQIPELVLKGPHRIAAEQLGEEVLWPLFHLMYGAAPNHFSSIQLAQYRPREGTDWHHDAESEASCIISLAPHRHKGGGTALRPAGAIAPAVLLNPLPQGSALLFNGRTTLHRGLPTTEGQRNLLVFWMMHKASCTTPPSAL